MGSSAGGEGCEIATVSTGAAGAADSTAGPWTTGWGVGFEFATSGSARSRGLVPSLSAWWFVVVLGARGGVASSTTAAAGGSTGGGAGSGGAGAGGAGGVAGVGATGAGSTCGSAAGSVGA